MNISGKGSPLRVWNEKTKQWQYEVELDKIELGTEDLKGNIKGGDIAKVLGRFTEIFFEFIKNFLMTTFNQAMRESLEDTIN